eukprot:3624080-Lingulodinium_polyedra.AAC.1
MEQVGGQRALPPSSAALVPALVLAPKLSEVQALILEHNVAGGMGGVRDQGRHAAGHEDPFDVQQAA